MSRQYTRVETKVSFLFQIYFSSRVIGVLYVMERDFRMNKVNDLILFESVILHCQMTQNISGTREALVAALPIHHSAEDCWDLIHNIGK